MGSVHNKLGQHGATEDDITQGEVSMRGTEYHNQITHGTGLGDSPPMREQSDVNRSAAAELEYTF